MQTDKKHNQRPNRKDPVTITNLITSGPLARIIEKSSEIDHLNLLLSDFLTDNLRHCYQVSNIVESIVHVRAINATYAALLKYKIPEIIRVFQKNCKSIKVSDIKLKIKPT